MVRIENHCCDCAVPGYPCLGENCPNRYVRVFYCDRCKGEIGREDNVYTSEIDGKDLCEECYNAEEEEE
jgi:hypothetical protein